MPALPPAIFIMGPTAAGKTDIAIALAQQANVEIISVDSALVYRGMDIGTAKPDAATLAQYPHHLVDITEPDEPYSVGQFRHDALQLMAEITARGKIPLLVGGTMLYFHALQHGLADLPAADMAVRASLDAEASEQGWEFLHQRLATIDPISAARIHPTDPQRLQRALEVYEISGKTMTELTEKTAVPLPYQISKLIIAPFDRAVLHQRIAARYQNMIAAGLMDEVIHFYEQPQYHAALPAMRAVGYRQLWAHLNGEYDQATAIERAIIATRQMAKRQLTWCRSQADGVWSDSGEDPPIAAVQHFLDDLHAMIQPVG